MSETHSTDFAKQLELAWAAGFFDGEGCTFLHIISQGKFKYVRLTIGQVDTEVLHRFQHAVDGRGRICGPLIRKNPNHKSQYQWKVCGIEAKAVLQLLWPYLSTVKRRQAERVLSEEKVAGRIWNRNKTHCIRGHPLVGDNLSIDKKGCRICKTCRKEDRRRYRAKKRLEEEL